MTSYQIFSFWRLLIKWRDSNSVEGVEPKNPFMDNKEIFKIRRTFDEMSVAPPSCVQYSKAMAHVMATDISVQLPIGLIAGANMIRFFRSTGSFERL